MADPSSPPSYDYVAYIDESGDPGIRRVKPVDRPGSSEWLMISAVVIAAKHEAEVETWAAELMAAMQSHQLRDLHFQKLTAARKLIACEHVATKPVRCFVVSSNKQNMRGYRNPRAEQIPSDNWFYCWMTRVVLERVTHWVKRRSMSDYGEVRRVKVVFSERGGLSYSQMNAYFEWLKLKGDNQVLTRGNIAYETMDNRLLEVRNHKGHAGLKLPDIVASAFFKGADVWDTGALDSQFAKALGPRMAAAKLNGESIVAGYGVKLWPGYKQLEGKVQPEQLEAFRYFGYPKQWWQ